MEDYFIGLPLFRGYVTAVQAINVFYDLFRSQKHLHELATRAIEVC